jgi:hypothetical protein
MSLAISALRLIRAPLNLATAKVEKYNAYGLSNYGITKKALVIRRSEATRNLGFCGSKNPESVVVGMTTNSWR